MQGTLQIITGGMTKVQQVPLIWIKSSYSQMNGHCVEVAGMPGNGVSVRDSQDRQGDILRFSSREWTSFVTGVRASSIRVCG
jgi:uncharacterized protein DUF397